MTKKGASMRIEMSIDRSGFYWAGLGVAVHVHTDGRSDGEAWGWWARDGVGSRSFRLGGFRGVFGRN